MRTRPRISRLLRVSLGLVPAALLGLSWASQSEDVFPAKPFSVTQHHPKIESALEILARSGARSPETTAQALTPRQASYFQPTQGTVRVIIEPEGKSSLAINPDQLQAVGAIIEARSRSFLRVRVPLKNLRTLAESVNNIKFIRRALPMIESSTKVSEGVVATGASLFHSQGFKGQRVRVGVIDLGFSQLTKAKFNGTLPPEVVVDETDYSDTGLETGTAHGTAVAEVIHDMAPDAWIFLKKATDEVELEQAVDDAIAQGIKVINYSVGVANSNFNDGTGIIDEIVDHAREAGILWVNAAGNHARSHWAGPFTDNNHDDWLDFAPGQDGLNIQVQSFFPIEVYLTWDAWPVTSEDFDLFLYDAAGRLVASSQNYQTGFEPPTEELDYMPQGVGTYQLKVLARHVRSLTMHLNLFVFGEHPVSPFVPGGSLLAPSDARGALAVGAISARNWKTGPQEDYSSQGPTSDGRIKPDLSGPDQVANWALFNFGGTSAASPHVAGAAALLLSRDRDLNADQLQQMLETSAIDMGAPQKDSIYGAGRLELSFGPVSARRSIQSAAQSSKFEFDVEIIVQMPIGLFGAVELVERLPQGFSLIPTQNHGARFKQPTSDSNERDYSWTWVLGSGEIRKIRYRLAADAASVTPGLYALVGTVNGAALQGDSQVRVINLATLSRQIELKPKPLRTGTPLRLVISQRKPTVRFQAQGSFPMSFQVSVYDLSGRLLYSEDRPTDSLEFSGLDRAGRSLPNGVYFYIATIRDRSGNIYQSRLERFVFVR